MMRPGRSGGILPTVGDVSILVVDDHAVFAEAVQAWLAREADFRPIWTAATAADACALIDRYRPGVVVLDLGLGDGSGLDVLEYARTRSPDTRVLMLTAASSTDSVIAALRQGARGEAWLAPDLLGRVLTELVAQPAAPPPDPLASLTLREHEVLQCLVDGLSRAEIAARLHVSANTVRTHTQNLLAKLGVHSTLASVALAMRHGLRSSDT